jgi:hypothetical protein
MRAGGLVLPYSTNYGGANPVAFAINSTNNTTPIEVSQGGLVSTVPAFRATTLGEKGIEVESSSESNTNVTARFFNENKLNTGTILKLENEGAGLALTAHSHLGAAAIIDGNVNKLGSVLEVSNLGIGKVIQVTNGNPATVENTMEISSATNSSILKLESTRNANQSAATALELKNGYLRVDQSSDVKTAFKHTTNTNNVTGNATVLYYPGAGINDILIVTKGLPYINKNYLVWYDSVTQRWKIALEDTSMNMPIGVTFNVLIIKP